MPIDVLDQYRRLDGQPEMAPSFDARIALDVRLCEPYRSVGGMVQACQGPKPHDPGAICGRISFRNVGDDPWVTCVCGHTFNANYANIGETPWPWPRDGNLIIKAAE